MIEINNLTKNRVDEKFLKGLAKRVLEGPSFAKASAGKEKKEFNLSIALVGQGRIKELNKRYRKKNKATNVLSFQYDNSGEVVICLREVKKNAKQFKSTYKKELTRVLIHGILHILGYNHQRMKKKELYYVTLCQKQKLSLV